MGARGLVAVVVGAAVLCFAAIGIAASSPQHITPSGVGGVKLGKTYKQLHNKHLIGSIRHGCELGGPNTRAARLRAPLKGSVNFTMTAPRKVTDITIRAGATARGIGIGATITQIKAVFPKAKVDHSTDQTFLLTLVRIPKSGGGKLMFAVDTKTHKVTLIGIPIIAFCE
jgi:hypothetical protein